MSISQYTILLALFVSLGSVAQPGDPSGIYVTQNQSLTLSLEARQDGSVVGSLQDEDQTFGVTLGLSNGQYLGAAQNSNGQNFPVLAQLVDGVFHFKIYQADAQGNVISESGIQYDFELATTHALRRGSSQQNPSNKAALTGNFSHPDGYFAMQVPPNWSAEMMSDDIFLLRTGHEGELVLALMAQLEPDEVGRPIAENMRSAHEMIDGLLAENFNIYADSSRAEVQLTRIGNLEGGMSERPAQGANANVTIWQGVVVDGKSAFVLMSTMAGYRKAELTSVLTESFKTVQLNRTWDIADFVAASGRRVSFNGKAVSDEDLARLEGGIPVIPDGAYWYDSRSGMAGMIGGPTEAYLATGLDLGGALSPNASGGNTRVAFNGRYLHPIDLAGLEMYFGEIQPGRYWLDGSGNYGAEAGPKVGNLVEEIAAIQMLAANLQAQYQQQLNNAVQQYQTQGGGYYGQGGGYQQGGGSVYSHFPNLGASGSGVSVANVGGGDTIVNAGGVMWWPGK